MGGQDTVAAGLELGRSLAERLRCAGEGRAVAFVHQETVEVGGDGAVAVEPGHHRFPEIVWEHSHVVIDSNGTPKSYCVYAAPNEEMVREHAQLLGDHFVQEIYEIAGDVSPADFPLIDDPTSRP